MLFAAAEKEKYLVTGRIRMIRSAKRIVKVKFISVYVYMLYISVYALLYGRGRLDFFLDETGVWK